MKKTYLSILVDNHEGVLTRLSSLFCQRGFNIDSLTVSATDDETLSRITITTTGGEEEIKQIINQTLVKIAVDESNRSSLLEIASIYKAKIIDISVGSMVFEITGKPAKLDSYLDSLKPYTILEMCRSGATALQRGEVKMTK